MNDVILGHLVVELVLLLLNVEQLQNNGDILLLHGSDLSLDVDFLLVRKPVHLLELLDGDMSRLVGVLDLKKFGRIDESIHVVGGAEWCRH